MGECARACVLLVLLLAGLLVMMLKFDFSLHVIEKEVLTPVYVLCLRYVYHCARVVVHA